MSHIDFDEIVTFVLSKKINREYLELAARVNSHLVSCPECFKTYKAIKSFCESFEEAIHARSTDKKMVRILQSIYKSSTEEKTLDMLISDFKDKLKEHRSVFSLNVMSNDEISLSDIVGGVNFYHPVENGDGKECDTRERKDILTDGNSNSISLSSDGRLSFRLDQNICRAGNIMYLLSDDDDAEVSLQIAKESDDGSVELSYDGVSSGEYSILM